MNWISRELRALLPLHFKSICVPFRVFVRGHISSPLCADFPGTFHRFQWEAFTVSCSTIVPFRPPNRTHTFPGSTFPVDRPSPNRPRPGGRHVLSKMRLSWGAPHISDWRARTGRIPAPLERYATNATPVFFSCRPPGGRTLPGLVCRKNEKEREKPSHGPFDHDPVSLKNPR